MRGREIRQLVFFKEKYNFGSYFLFCNPSNFTLTVCYMVVQTLLILAKKKVLKVGHLIDGIFKNSFYGSLTFVKFLSQQRNRCNALSRSLTKEERNLFVFFHPLPPLLRRLHQRGQRAPPVLQLWMRDKKAHITSSTYASTGCRWIVKW